MRSFRSDNNAGLVPEALAAIADANDGHDVAYSDDAMTAEARRLFGELFGDRSTTFFVATGSAANTLAVASLTRPWQRIICHVHSHLNDDESTAPERFTQCRMTAVHTESSKLTAEDVERVAANGRDDVHQPQPGVVSLTNPTEFGTVYTPGELRAICDIAHRHGYRVHVDGARFANAVSSLNCDPMELAGAAGVDVLCLGGTKNGLACSEAVVFFEQPDTAHGSDDYRQAVSDFEMHRKSTGHLLSKHRFVTAPFVAVLTDGAWLRHARHANDMAAGLGAGFERLGIPLRFPVQANGVFAQLDDRLHEALQGMDYGYYPFGDAAWKVYRFMCSFDTQPGDVQQLLDDAQHALQR